MLAFLEMFANDHEWVNSGPRPTDGAPLLSLGHESDDDDNGDNNGTETGVAD